MRIAVSLVSVLLLGATLAWGNDGKMNEIVEKAKKLQERYRAEVKTLSIDAVMKYEKDSREKMPAGDGEGYSEFKSRTYVKGDNYRYSMTVEGEKEKGAPFETHFVKNGEGMWTVTSFVGKRKVKEYLPAAKNNGYLTSWKFLDEQGKYIGEETVDGRQCYVVEVRGLEEGTDPKEGAKKGDIQTAWLAEDTLAMVKLKYMRKKEAYEVRSSSFKTVKGWEFPYRMDFSVNGKPSCSMIVSAVRINEPADDSLFDPDKIEVQKLDFKKNMMKGFMGGALGR